MIIIVLFLAAPSAASGRARPERPDFGGTGRHAVIQRPRASFGPSGPFLCIVLVHILRFPMRNRINSVLQALPEFGAALWNRIK